MVRPDQVRADHITLEGLAWSGSEVRMLKASWFALRSSDGVQVIQPFKLALRHVYHMQVL